MGEKILGKVGAQRDLCVLALYTASFIDHLHAQVSKANKMLGFICRTISGSKIFILTLRSLYVISVRFRLEYAVEIWSPKSDAIIKMNDGVQRRVTRLMLPDFSYNECLKRLNLLPLVYRRAVKDLSTFYKLKFGHFTLHLIRSLSFVQRRD